MGSFNVKCQISGYTIGENDPVVGFFLVPQDYQDDQSHRIDSPLKSMFQQWQPLSLPVKGHYGDFGRLITSNKNAPGVKRTALSLGGFQFSRDEWKDLSAAGLYPDFIGPSEQSKSPLKLWLIRSDVYASIVGRGSYHRPHSQEPLPSKDLEDLSTVFGQIDPESRECQEGVSFFNGLAAMGYNFRSKPEKVSQNHLKDHKRVLSIQKKLRATTDAQKDLVATLSDGEIVRCGLTDRPLSTNEPFYFLQLRANGLVQSDNNTLKWPSDHAVSSHYQAHGPIVEAVIDECGEVIAKRDPDARLSGRLGIISQRLLGNGISSSGPSLSAMVVSKSAFDTLIQASPYTSIVKSDRAVMMDALHDLRSLVQDQNAPALEAFFDSHGSGHINEIVHSEGHTSDQGISEYHLRSLHHVLQNVDSPGDKNPERNFFSGLLNVSSDTPLSAPGIRHFTRTMEAFIKCSQEDLADKEAELLHMMDVAENILGFEKALNYMGSSFSPTEALKPAVEPCEVREAWHAIHELAYGNVNRDLRNMETSLNF